MAKPPNINVLLFTAPILSRINQNHIYDSDTYHQIGVKNETIKKTKTPGMFTSIELMSGKEETNAIQATKSSKVTLYSKNQPSKQQVYPCRKSSDNEC